MTFEKTATLPVSPDEAFALITHVLDRLVAYSGRTPAA